MQKMTIGRMAKMYGLHRSTLYEAVDKGRVSAGVDGKGQRVIDLSEMIRVYGEPPGQTRQNPTHPTDTSQTPPADALQPLLEELRLLREEVAGLRAELRLIEHKPSAPPAEVLPQIEEVSGGDKPPSAPAKSFADLLASLGD